MSIRLVSTLAGLMMMAGALFEAPVVAAAPLQVPSSVVAGTAQPLAAEHVYYCRYGRCYGRRYAYRNYYYRPRYYGYGYGYRHYYSPGLSFRLF